MNYLLSLYTQPTSRFLLDIGPKDLEEQAKGDLIKLGLVNEILQDDVHPSEEALEFLMKTHAQMLLTDRGMKEVREKYLNGVFPMCPRLLCEGASTLPISIEGPENLSLFCPRCKGRFISKEPLPSWGYFCSQWIDPFIEKNRDIFPDGTAKIFTPTIFGFPVGVIN